MISSILELPINGKTILFCVRLLKLNRFLRLVCIAVGVGRPPRSPLKSFPLHDYHSPLDTHLGCCPVFCYYKQSYYGLQYKSYCGQVFFIHLQWMPTSGIAVFKNEVYADDLKGFKLAWNTSKEGRIYIPSGDLASPGKTRCGLNSCEAVWVGPSLEPGWAPTPPPSSHSLWLPLHRGTLGRRVMSGLKVLLCRQHFCLEHQRLMLQSGAGGRWAWISSWLKARSF